MTLPPRVKSWAFATLDGPTGDTALLCAVVHDQPGDHPPVRLTITRQQAADLLADMARWVADGLRTGLPTGSTRLDADIEGLRQAFNRAYGGT